MSKFTSFSMFFLIYIMNYNYMHFLIYFFNWKVISYDPHATPMNQSLNLLTNLVKDLNLDNLDLIQK